MILHVDTNHAIPPYEQIRAQIEKLAESGELPPGTRLPTIRQLAGDLGIAPGTVARAYRELEAAGVVHSRVRHGTIVVEQPKPTARQAKQQLAAAARTYALAARALGVDRNAANAELNRQLDQI